jgi:V/A-type H+-transporting ATPase subunit C
VEDVERAFDRALDDLYGFLVTANLPDPVISFFRVPYDYANLKARLKAELLGTSTDGLLVDLGTVPAERFAGLPAQMPRRFRALYEQLASAGAGTAAEGAPAHSGVRDEERVSAAVDRALFAELAEHAKASKSAFLTGLASLQIDVANIRTLMRARGRERHAAETRALLFEGGGLAPQRLMLLYSQPVEALAAALVALPGPFKGMHVADLADLAHYDVLADDLVVRYLMRARMAAAGPEPVIGYVMARQAEVTMVRTLLIGRMSGVPSEVLRRRLRERYG